MASGSATPNGRATPIAVTWDWRRKTPTAFVWRKRRYRIEIIQHSWVVETGWWNEQTRVIRYYNRVQAEGRLFDIYFDRREQEWFLERALN